MASKFMRFFETVPPSIPGTVFTMSASVTGVVDKPAFIDFLTANDLTMTEVDPQHFIALHDSGQPMSWREVIISPPLDITTRHHLARLVINSLTDDEIRHNNAYVVDCTANPRQKYKPVIAWY